MGWTVRINTSLLSDSDRPRRAAGCSRKSCIFFIAHEQRFKLTHPIGDVLRFLSIKVRLIRHDEIYAVPILLEPRYKTVFDVWDEHMPAKQKGREWKKLSVADLKPGDAFDVEFVCLLDDYFVFDFFQVEVYYSIGHGK